MYHPILRPGAQRQLKKIGGADLVIGLPSYKNTQVAAHVTRVALEGVHLYYPQLRTVLINADAGLKATTRRTVAAQATNNGHHSIIISGRYDGLLGQGSASAALLDAALALDAKAIVILDSHTAGITPNWVAGLAHLILENKADLVVPRYRQWAIANGLLSDLVVYPLFRSLWGQSLRRPAAPDFGLSPQLAATLLDEDIWGTAVAAFGLSPWLTSYSVINRWRIAQSALGEKLSLAESTSKQISQKATLRFQACFADILSTLFSLAYKYRYYWQNINSVRSVPTLTHFASAPHLDKAEVIKSKHPQTAPDTSDEKFAISKNDDDPTLHLPEPFSILEDETARLLDDLALGWIEYRVMWRRILAPDNLAQVEALATLSPDRFYFPSDLWARIIYDFVVVFNKGVIDPVQVVASLFPLYQGRLAAFQQEIAGLALLGYEGTVAAQAVEFEETRDYLKQRWQAYQHSH